MDLDGEVAALGMLLTTVGLLAAVADKLFMKDATQVIVQLALLLQLKNDTDIIEH